MQTNLICLFRCFSILFFSLIPALGNGQAGCDCPSFTTTVKAGFEEANRLLKMQDALVAVNGIKKDNDPCCQAIACAMEAILYNTQGKTTESFESAQKSLLLLNGQYNAFASIESTRMIGMYYNRRGNADSAVLMYFKSLGMAEKEKEYYTQAKIYANLSLVYINQKQFAKGLEFTKKSLEAARLTKDTGALAQSYANMVTIYGNMYDDTENKAYLDSAQQIAGVALLYARASRQPTLLIRNFLSLGKFALAEKIYPQAMKYTDSILLLVDEKTNPAILNSLYKDRGAAFTGLKLYPQAIENLEKALACSKQSKNLYMQKMAYESLYEAYKANGETALALQTLEQYKNLSDSLVTKQNAEAINEMEQKYNKVENEKKISKLAYQKSTYLLLALAGLLALIGLAFFIRQQSLKSKQKIMETEQRLNRARMNPHFFFNALASLQSFALQESDGKALASNLSKFSHIMRETLESTYKEYVTLEQEKDFLEEYLELQRMRFPQKFSYAITIDETIDSDQVVIPSMILQPFVENSIEHGFTGIDYSGDITLTFLREAKDLHIAITDNGKGLAVYDKESNEHISRASQIIRDRIYLLNVKLKTRASFSIDNAANGKGVTVSIKLPFLFKGDVKG